MMLTKVFSLDLLRKNLQFDSSLEKQDSFMIVSSNNDFSEQNSKDTEIFDFLTNNSFNNIKLTSEVSEVYPFYGVHIVKIFDFSESSVTSIPSRMFRNSIALEEVIMSPTIKNISEYAFENSAISKINLEHIELSLIHI